MGARHFFIVGAQRSGTTLLYHLLASHPDITMAAPVKPEPKFFLLDHLYHRGLGYYQATFFGNATARLRGEKTVSYMESDTAARRIAESFPNARILFLLRNPIERAVSHYWFSVENGVETLPMEEAFEREEAGRSPGPWQGFSMSPFAYLRRGCYITDIPRYETLLGRERLRILLYEDLVRDPESFRRLCRWLGVSDEANPSAPPSASRRAKSPREALPLPLLRRLRSYFEAPTAALGERYGLDLKVWTEEWMDSREC